MIKKIQSLKWFGIFHDYTNAKAKDFKKYNLFYGWNGVGKSTLSSLFRCIENHTMPDEFPAGEFTINIENGPAITQASLDTVDLNIRTFSRDFIDQNISWDSMVKSILLVDKGKIAERRKLAELKKQQESDHEKHDRKEQEMQVLEDTIEKFCTDSARRIKTSLRSIGTDDSHYMNYNKTNFKKFIEQNFAATKSNESLLDAQKMDELRRAAKTDKKSKVFFEPPQTISDETFTRDKISLDTLLRASVVNQTIQRFAEHGDINEWVKTGLSLHKCHKLDQCEFCDNSIAAERIKQLEAHFNDDYKSLQEQLAQTVQWLDKKQSEILPQLPPESDFYEEFRKEYNKSRTALEKAATVLSDQIIAWQKILEEKMKNPFKTELTVKTIKMESFNDAITAIRMIVEKHNRKTTSFQKEIGRAMKALELHYTTEGMNFFKYHEKKKKLHDHAASNNKLKAKIDERERKIRTLEDSLSGEILGAKQFNKSLHKFLGRCELTLSFDPEKKGYAILRNGYIPAKENLSESEKTAIAFVYFITKLKEKDNNIEDTIIVIDDPVSSFDSHNLFNAFSFMKINCEKAKQLFVLTHSFAFFKLVRDWMRRKNKGQDVNFYVVEANKKIPRSATLANAEQTLIHYHSEYHYIFSRLYSLREKKRLELDDCFLAANLARKVLEICLAFKFPKYRGNFSELFHAAAGNSLGPEDESKEKILKFVNKYSHGDSNDESIDNLMGESPAVIEDIFSWIEEMDSRHYKEMMKVVGQ